MAWYGKVLYGYGMVWCGMVWYGMVMVWYGWYGNEEEGRRNELILQLHLCYSNNKI